MLEPGRSVGLLIAVAICLSVIVMIVRAKTGHVTKLREPAGVKGLEILVQRSIEMGRPVLFGASSPHIKVYTAQGAAPTLAALALVDRLAEYAGKYDAKLITCTGRTEDVPIMQRIVSERYYAAGRPYDELYSVRFFPEQAYIASVVSAIQREKPAACLFAGAIVVESVIWGETALSVGAISLGGGTAMNNIPFLITTCEWVLIGEELYAAAAMIRGDPSQMGSIVAQDAWKYLALGLVAIGVSLISLGSKVLVNLLKV